jgi:hypothetical protein
VAGYPVVAGHPVQFALRNGYLKLSVDLTGADPGDYLLDFRVHDAEGVNKTAMIELPITLE